MSNTGEPLGLKTKLGQLFTSGCIAFGVALGKQLGLFALMSKLPGQFTSQDLADAGGFKERYIREWLGQMICSQMVQFDPPSEKFFFSAEASEALNGSVPAFLEALPIFGQRHEALKKCFQLDGPNGIPLSETPTTGALLQSLRNSQNNLEELLAGGASVPGLQEKLEKGIVVADIGCGTGELALQIAKAFPNSSIFAYDNDEMMLNFARQSADRENIANITFGVADIHKLPEDWTKTFDYILCYDVVHDLAWPQKALGELQRILKDDGTLTVVEPKISSSLKDQVRMGDSAAMFYTISLYWCLSSSLAVEGSEGWGTTMGQEIIEGMLKNAGLHCPAPVILVNRYYHYICTKL